MNMMEFVKLFRKVDILESNQNYIYTTLKKLAKSDRKIKNLMIICGLNFSLLAVYNAMTDKELKGLKNRITELEAAEGYKNCDVCCGDCEEDPEDMFEDTTK